MADTRHEPGMRNFKFRSANTDNAKDKEMSHFTGKVQAANGLWKLSFSARFARIKILSFNGKLGPFRTSPFAVEVHEASTPRKLLFMVAPTAP